SICFPKKDCIGAIDETRSRVKVPRVKALRFCGRKDHLTQNILAACGNCLYSRTLKDDLSKEYPLQISE
ncbi:hypothetical protein S245_001661, partial [Arachis hypogaea]